MIEIQELTKRYGTLTAVDRLSVTIRDGLIYGFLGANGAGKSTTLGMLTGCLAPSSGNIRINGHDLFSEPLEAKRLIGYLPEIPPLYPEMSVYEYLRFIARARGIAKSGQSAAIEDAMRKTSLQHVRCRLLQQLSKGYRQRVGLAQAILGEPDIIVLDEPTVGLDPGQVVETRELIRSLGGRHTVIFSSHILSEVSLLCDRVLIIDHGRILCEDTPENLEHMLDNGEVLEITVLDPQCKAEEAIENVPGISRIETAPNPEGSGNVLSVHMEQGANPREAVALALAGAGIAVLGMQIRQHSLEDAFIRLTQNAETTQQKEGKA